MRRDPSSRDLENQDAPSQPNADLSCAPRRSRSRIGSRYLRIGCWYGVSNAQRVLRGAGKPVLAYASDSRPHPSRALAQRLSQPPWIRHRSNRPSEEPSRKRRRHSVWIIRSTSPREGDSPLSTAFPVFQWQTPRRRSTSALDRSSTASNPRALARPGSSLHPQPVVQRGELGISPFGVSSQNWYAPRRITSASCCRGVSAPPPRGIFN